MTERTGLGVLEVAVLRAVDAVADGHSHLVRSSDVLEALEHEGFGADYLYPVLQDLALPWRTRLPLLGYDGNLGSWGSDPAAEADYTRVRLSRIGRLALQSEAGAVGPIPLGLVEGSAYRGGRVPPWSPARVADALQVLLADDSVSDVELHALVGPPELPTGGIVEGDLAALLGGDTARLTVACRIHQQVLEGRRVLEITGYPLGVDVDAMLASIADRRYQEGTGMPGRRLVADLQDRSNDRTGVRLHVVLTRDADADEAEEWLRDIPPVTVEVDWRLPAPMAQRLRDAAARTRPDPSGFEMLRELI